MRKLLLALVAVMTLGASSLAEPETWSHVDDFGERQCGVASEPFLSSEGIPCSLTWAHFVSHVDSIGVVQIDTFSEEYLDLRVDGAKVKVGDHIFSLELIVYDYQLAAGMHIETLRFECSNTLARMMNNLPSVLRVYFGAGIRGNITVKITDTPRAQEALETYVTSCLPDPLTD